MDKGMPMHKEMAMGLKGAKKEAAGTFPGAKDKKVKNMKHGGMCYEKGGKVKK